MPPVDRLGQDRSLPMLAERRLAAALLVVLQTLAVIWLVERLLGWRVALLAALLLGLDPFSLSEGRLFRLEMVANLFVCLSILAYFLYLRRRQRVWLLLSGVMGELGVSSKVSAGLLVPYIWLLLLLDFLLSAPASTTGSVLVSRRASWRQKLATLLTNGLLWVGGAVGAFWLIWPAMWVRPGEALDYIFRRGLLQVSADSVWHGPVFFWGRIFPSEDPGPFFYPVVFAFRTTPLVWIGAAGALLLAGALGVWPALRRQILAWGPWPEMVLWRWPWPIVAVVLLAAYVLLMILELSSSISKVDRYLLLVFPALAILAAIGLAALVTGLARLVPPLTRSGVVWVAAALVVLALQLWVALPAHPYYYTYWNPWLGGGRAAMATLPLGSGEGVDLAMDYLNSQPGAAQSTLVCGGSQPWCSNKFVGKTLRYATYFNGDWVTANYASFYISHLQRQTYPPEIVDFFMRQAPLYRVELGGATYMWVYAVPPISHYAGPENDLAGLGRLLGYNLRPPVVQGSSQVEAGRPVEMTVWWTDRGAGVDNLVLRLVDETGYEWQRARSRGEPDGAAVTPDQPAIVVSKVTLTTPPDIPPGLYFLRLGITAPGEERLLGEFRMPDEADQLLVTPGRTRPDPARLAIPRPVNRSLAPGLVLLGYAPPEQVLTPRQPVWLALSWQAAGRPADYQVLLKLVNEAGRELYRWQGRPGHGRYPTQDWPAGQIVRDVWPLQVADETPVGRYRLELSLLDTAGASLPGSEVDLGPIEVWPQPLSFEMPEMQASIQASFEAGLTLLGYDLYFDLKDGGGILTPSFYWQSQADMEQAFDLGLILRQATTGAALKEWRVPLGPAEAKAFWKTGEIVNTIYQLEAETGPGQAYHLDIALFNQSDDRPVPVKLGDGPPAEFVRLENIQDKIAVRTASQAKK